MQIERRKHQAATIPSPSEIAERAAAIRERWTPEEEIKRRVVKGDRPVIVPLVAVSTMLESAVA